MPSAPEANEGGGIELVSATPALAATEASEPATTPNGYRRKIAGFIDSLLEKREKKHALANDPGVLELFARSLDAVQETVTRFKLAAQPPDLIVSIPRNVCAFYEFHRAEEVIELGRLRTREALRHWQVPTRR